MLFFPVYNIFDLLLIGQIRRRRILKKEPGYHQARKEMMTGTNREKRGWMPLLFPFVAAVLFIVFI